MPNYIKKNLVSTKEDKQFISEVQNLVRSRMVYSNLEETTFLGSTARDTYYGRPKEFDFFLTYKSKLFEVELFKKETIKNFENLDCKIEFKSRGFPYITISFFYKVRIVSVDLVPCLIEKTEEGPVDRTIFHHKYVNQNITEPLKFEIKRFKRLLKRKGLYGANSEIKGLSGYCCEVLILKYKKVELIDPTLEVLEDPCDSNRNLFASMSKKTLQRFQFLLRYNFKIYNNLHSRVLLYEMRKAPLKLLSIVESSPFVAGAVWTKEKLMVELKDHFIKTPYHKIINNNKYFELKQGVELYTTYEDFVKKKNKELFLSNYPEFKKSNSNKTLYTYNFFK